ncbi:DUF84 family protein [Saliterribacillus persicus]|uniref:inosine/xanthosine triphosphatase n=1 Tax=Saliterribacillus persicus TaxID=930114 RepID=A0A368X4P8_9BACI|nr:DUF84 family protein [Saliterribacillus persicus]RCW62669.1 inosine/xanthosine triphosphatase [Saliterribacillus persicus]
MDIIIGSTNKAKVAAVSEVFPSDKVESIKTESNVSSQPISDLETKKGAINRAIASYEYKPGSLGIGLEGGIMEIEKQTFLINWGAIYAGEKKLFVASGARIPLPEFIAEKLHEGKELGDIMDEFTKEKNIRHHAGAIGIFTNNIVKRKDMFEHVIKLAYGQYLFYGQKDLF